MVRVAFAVLIVGALVIVTGAVFYGLLVRDASLARSVQQENKVLRERIGTLEEIEREVQQLDQIRQRLYALAGVPDSQAISSRSPAGAESAGSRLRYHILPGNQLAELTDAALQSPLRVVPVQGPVSRGFTIGNGQKVEHAGVDIAGAEGSASPATRASPDGVSSPSPRELKKDWACEKQTKAEARTQSAEVRVTRLPDVINGTCLPAGGRTGCQGEARQDRSGESGTGRAPTTQARR